jgi:hypothetical protein
MPVIPALRRLRHEEYKFETKVGYIARPCLKTKQNNKENNASKPLPSGNLITENDSLDKKGFMILEKLS